MKLRSGLLAVALVAGTLAAPSIAEAKPAVRKAAVRAPADPAAHKAECDRLALSLAPDSAVPSQVDRLLKATLAQMLKNDEGMAELEQAYPGLLVAMGEAERPILLREGLAVLPLYRADLSEFYCQNLTTLEARTAANFFSSADGVQFLKIMNEQVDYAKTAGGLSRDAEASQSQILSDKQAAASRAVGQMPRSLKIKANRFFNSPVGRKLISLGPRKNAIDQKWFNFVRPGVDKEVRSAMAQAMVDHIAKTDPETAAKIRTNFEDRGILPVKD